MLLILNPVSTWPQDCQFNYASCLKERSNDLMASRKREYYGFDPRVKRDNFPGIYGNKTDIILKALDFLDQSRATNYKDPWF